MGHGLDERELRRRAIDGVRDEVEAFGFIEMWELRK
jgi:hypothetical protein